MVLDSAAEFPGSYLGNFLRKLARPTPSPRPLPRQEKELHLKDRQLRPDIAQNQTGIDPIRKPHEELDIDYLSFQGSLRDLETALEDISKGFDTFPGGMVNEFDFDLIKNRVKVNGFYEITLNDHTVEGRGKNLAETIARMTEIAYLSPDPEEKDKYKIITRAFGFAAKNIVEGCSKVVHIAAQFTDERGKTRTVAILFAFRDEDKRWAQVTALYRAQTLEKYEKNKTDRARRLFRDFKHTNDFPRPTDLLRLISP